MPGMRDHAEFVAMVNKQARAAGVKHMWPPNRSSATLLDYLGATDKTPESYTNAMEQRRRALPLISNPFSTSLPGSDVTCWSSTRGGSSDGFAENPQRCSRQKQQ